MHAGLTINQPSILKECFASRQEADFIYDVNTCITIQPQARQSDKTPLTTRDTRNLPESNALSMDNHLTNFQ